MNRKTPKHVLELLKRHENLIQYITECIRAKTTVPVENQAPHIRDNSVEGWVGMASGCNAMLEESLSIAGCYAGFCYLAAAPIYTDGGGKYVPSTNPPSTNPNNPDFAEWRRQYFARL